MLIVILLLLIGLTVGSFFGIYHHHGHFCDDDRIGWSIGNVFCWLGILATIVAMMVLGGNLVNEKALDKQIKMHQEENNHIETVVKVEVQNYMQFEHDTYVQIQDDENVEILILRYPELKSNELVQQQITLLQENNKTIRELKTQKIKLITYRWWLYFGC